MSISKVLSGPAGYALAIAAGGVVLYLLWDKIGGAVGGIASGNNAATNSARTDAYKGKGIIGTLGAAVDNTLGGLPSITGEAIGGWLYDLTHTTAYNPSTGLQSAQKTVRDGANNIDALWGSVGSVQLRAV